MEITEVFLVDVLRAIRGLQTKEQVDTYIDNLTRKHASFLWALFRHIDRHVLLTEGNLSHTRCFLCTWHKASLLYDRLRACQQDTTQGGHVEFAELCRKLRAGLTSQGLNRADLVLPGEAQGDREPVTQDPKPRVQLQGDRGSLGDLRGRTIPQAPRFEALGDDRCIPALDFYWEEL